MYSVITSTQNEKIKLVRALKQKKFRDESGLFFAEGVNILRDVPKEYPARMLFIKESEKDRLLYLAESLSPESTFVVKDTIFDALGDTVSPNGAIAVFEKSKRTSTEGDTVLLLCSISDAGNMGTILRTACALDIKTVLLYGDCVDAYSPKVVRSSMGGIFQCGVISADLGTIVELSAEYAVVSLDMGGTSVFDYERNGKLILAVGSEAHGLPEEIRTLSKDIISLPMKGKMESLNAAVSLSTALYILENKSIK